MARAGWVAAAGGAFAMSVALSQVQHGEERDFPTRFGEIASENHGHEKGSDALADFFEGRLVAKRLKWLVFALGMIFLAKASID